MSENLTTARVIVDPLKMIPVTMMQDNVAASQTAVALLVAEVASAANNACDGITMPWAGTIVGVSYQLSAAGSAGTLTIAPTVNGTVTTDPALTVTTGTSGSDTAPRGVATFAAGDRIGAKITTDGSWNGTTADLVVTIFALTEISGV
jgi:hypothetical protein